MQALGTGGFFVYLAVAQAALDLYALWRRSRTAPAPDSIAAEPLAPGVPPPALAERSQAGSATQ
jgi:hypothetical protein